MRKLDKLVLGAAFIAGLALIIFGIVGAVQMFTGAEQTFIVRIWPIMIFLGAGMWIPFIVEWLDD